MATSTRPRLVAARATVTHMVVASVPFLAKIAQSAWSTRFDELLRQLDHDGARSVLAVGQRGLSGGSGLDRGVAVAEDDRSVAAHQIDVLVAVDVPHVATLASGHELREAVRQAVDTLVPPHAAGNHLLRSVSPVVIERQLGRGEVRRHGSLLVELLHCGAPQSVAP